MNGRIIGPVTFLVAACLGVAVSVTTTAAAPVKLANECNGLQATIISTAGHEVVFGTPADDVIVVSGGASVVYGMAGNDTICASGDDNVLYGDEGNDLLFADGRGNIIDGGAGHDICVGDRATNVFNSCEGNVPPTPTFTPTPTSTNTPTATATSTPTNTPTAAATSTPTSTPAAVAIATLRLPTNDLIYDSHSNRLFASVPSRAGALGNSVVSIDPATGTVGTSVFVGSEPDKLALSDNGQFIYVGLDGAAAVRRIDVASNTAGLQFSLGADSFFGSYFVEDMEVVPGDATAVAISREFHSVSPRHAGVAIYDNGVQRPKATPDFSSSGIISNRIEFCGDASKLYGYNNETTGFEFNRMRVDSSGVTLLDTLGNLISGFNVDIVCDSGRIYATNGQVIDPEARTLVGTFPGIQFPAIVRPDSKSRRTFFLMPGTGPSLQIAAFSQSAFILLGLFDVPGAVGPGTSLVRWGATGLAFRTSDDVVFLIQSPLVHGQTSVAR